MKIELELHNAKTEKPNHSCELLILERWNDEQKFEALQIPFSKKFDAFNVRDDSLSKISEINFNGTTYEAYYAEIPDEIQL